MLYKIYPIREARSTVEKILGRKELIQKHIEIYINIYITLSLSLYYMLTNTNRSTFTSFRITPSKSSVIFAAVLRVGAPSLPISGCLAVESRPVDLGIRRGKGRRDADETSCERGRVVRGGV